MYDMQETQTAAPFTSIIDACARLGFTPSAGYKLIKANEFPVEVVKVGRTLKVRTAQLDAFITGTAAHDDGATRVLLAVVEGHRTVRAVAAASGRNHSTTYDHLIVLRREGLVTWDEGKRATIRPLVRKVSAAPMAELPVSGTDIPHASVPLPVSSAVRHG